MVILGLGSNIGDRLAYLSAAVKCLSVLLDDMQLSRIFESAALVLPGAQDDSKQPYLNMAISGKTNLSPSDLFAKLKAIEQELGRVPRGVWQAREIDIDILGMDEVVMQTPELSIPHAELLNRDFALLPLNDVAPEWIYPVGGCYYQLKPAEIIALKGFSLGDGLCETGLKIHD